jgi:hypothetical protein
MTARSTRSAMRSSAGNGCRIGRLADSQIGRLLADWQIARGKINGRTMVMTDAGLGRTKVLRYRFLVPAIPDQKSLRRRAVRLKPDPTSACVDGASQPRAGGPDRFSSAAATPTRLPRWGPRRRRHTRRRDTRFWRRGRTEKDRGQDPPRCVNASVSEAGLKSCATGSCRVEDTT